MREAAPTLYDQLDAAYSSGFREGTGFLPVADLNPVRISLAAVTTKLDWHPFYVTLSRHPSGMYGVEIASFYGMTLGAPILFSGDGHRNSSSVNPRGEAISLAAKPTRFSNMMRDFDGNQVDLLGLPDKGQQVFAQQLGGWIFRQSMKNSKESARRAA